MSSETCIFEKLKKIESIRRIVRIKALWCTLDRHATCLFLLPKLEYLKLRRNIFHFKHDDRKLYVLYTFLHVNLGINKQFK